MSRRSARGAIKICPTCRSASRRDSRGDSGHYYDAMNEETQDLTLRLSASTVVTLRRLAAFSGLDVDQIVALAVTRYADTDISDLLFYQKVNSDRFVVPDDVSGAHEPATALTSSERQRLADNQLVKCPGCVRCQTCSGRGVIGLIREKVCLVCGGSGEMTDEEYQGQHTCGSCLGTGTVASLVRTLSRRRLEPCPTCSGSGKTVCLFCKGCGEVTRRFARTYGDAPMPKRRFSGFDGM